VRLAGLVKEQPETLGKRWVAEEEVDLGGLGVADWFARTVALDVGETACSVPSGWNEWEYLQPLPERRPWVLRWVRDGSSFKDVAFASSREELQELETLHGELRRRTRDLPETKAIATEYRRATEAAKSLAKELDRISNLATLRGRCALCDG